MSGFTLDWKGPRVAEDVREAATEAIEETLDRAAAIASALAPVGTRPRRGKRLSQSIRRYKTRHLRNGRIIGRWGSRKRHARPVEVGPYERPGVFYLTRAARREYPRLSGRVRRGMYRRGYSP